MSIESLPIEILLSVVERCSIRDRANLCLTSQALYGVCIEELYSSVNLGSHNGGDEAKPLGRLGRPIPLDFVDRDWVDLDYSIFRRQLAFISTLEKRPEYGEHVRELAWTVLDLSGHYWGHRRSQDIQKKSVPDSDLYEPEDEPLWQTFRSLKSVKRVDLCWLRPWREVTLPGRLFPSATALRLSGCLTREFCHSILGDPTITAHPKSHLRHLELSNPLQWSEVTPSLPLLSHLGELRTHLHTGGSATGIGEDTRLMSGLLDPFAGYYSNLSSLRITTYAHWFGTHASPRDEARYRSFARFLGSTRCSLREFSFEQGWDSNNSLGRSGLQGRPGPMVQQSRLMDNLFVDHLLPVLLEKQWPNLKRMEIKGVGSWQYSIMREHPPTPTELNDPDKIYQVYHRSPRGEYGIVLTIRAIPRAAEARLRSLLASDAVLVIEENASRDFENVYKISTGVPAGDQ